MGIDQVTHQVEVATDWMLVPYTSGISCLINQASDTAS